MCVIAKLEITPFFLWGHYSKQIPSRTDYQKILIRVDGKEFKYTELSFANREMIVLPLEYYCRINKSIPVYPDPFGDNREELTTYLITKYLRKTLSSTTYNYFMNKLTNSRNNMQKFPKWFKRYMNEVTNSEINKLEVLVGTFIYDSNNHIKLVKTTPVFDSDYPLENILYKEITSK